jgi:serine/threonine protein kinase
LNYTHNHGLVHRDIKPDNILLKRADSWSISLIDFGFACRPPSQEDSRKTITLTSKRLAGVFGTVPFASVNAHQTSGQFLLIIHLVVFTDPPALELTYRDDLESLAYTLLYLLCGSLPWSSYNKHGTQRGRIRQVYEQKKRYDSRRSSPNVPIEFGTLVEYARSLSAEKVPDYDDWRRQFKRIGDRMDVRAVVCEVPQPPSSTSAFV